MVWLAPVSITASTTMNRLSTGCATSRDLYRYLKCSHFSVTAAPAEGGALCAISVRCSRVGVLADGSCALRGHQPPAGPPPMPGSVILSGRISSSSSSSDRSVSRRATSRMVRPLEAACLAIWAALS